MISLVVLITIVGCTLGQIPQYRPNLIVRPTVPAPAPIPAIRAKVNYTPGQVIRIISQTQEGPNPDGSYAWSYETENGIAARETGVPKAQDLLGAQGEYKYTGLDGVPIQVAYTADENGFVAQGAHLPTPPPIPQEIVRSLEWNAAHPEEDDYVNPNTYRRQ